MGGINTYRADQNIKGPSRGCGLMIVTTNYNE